MNIKTKIYFLYTFLFLSSCVKQNILVRIEPSTELGSGPSAGIRSNAEAVVVRADVAATEGRRERGLKYVRHLAADRGMLFVFDPPETGVSFWMKDVRIPLDMIFCDADGRIVHLVRDARPGDPGHHQYDGTVRFVLEVNAGFINHRNVKTGDRVIVDSGQIRQNP